MSNVISDESIFRIEKRLENIEVILDKIERKVSFLFFMFWVFAIGFVGQDIVNKFLH